MNDTWNDMRRAKEEGYFEKKNREAVERLKQKQAAEKPRLSPVSGEPMVQEVLHGVVIDKCPTSGGIWLDAGELEELFEHIKKEEDSDEAHSSFLSTFFGSLSGKD